MILASCPVNSTGSPHDDSKREGGGVREERGRGRVSHVSLGERVSHVSLGEREEGENPPQS